MATAKKSTKATKTKTSTGKPRKGVVPPALRAHQFSKKTGSKKK